MTPILRSRVLVLLTVVSIVLAGSLSGCREKEKDAAAGTAGLTVSGTPDAANYRVTDAGPATPGQPWMQQLTPAFAIEPSGALSEPATVTISLSKPVGAQEIVLFGTRERTSDPWTYLPARVAAGGKAASAEVNHFSFFTAVLVTLHEFADVFTDQFQEALTGGLAQHIAKPACTDTQRALEDGYGLAERSKSDAVYWCFGLESGKRVVKLVNHRRYPMIVTHPKLDVLREKPASAQLSHLPALSRAFSGSDSVLASGDEIVYTAELPAGSRTSVTTEADHFGQSLAALQTGVTTLLEILTLVKPGAKTTAEAMDDVLRVSECAAPLASIKESKAGDYLVDCLGEDALVAIVGKTWAPVFDKLLATAKVLAFFQTEVNLLVDTTLEHDRLAIGIAHVSTGMTREDLLTAPVPELRGNPSGNLVDGKLPNPAGGGAVYLETSGGAAAALGDVTGDGGVDAAAVISFGSGAGGRDQTVFLYSKASGSVVRLAEYDPAAVDPGTHATITGMTITGGHIQLQWTTWSATTGTRMWQAVLEWRGSALVAASQGELSIGTDASRVGNEFIDALVRGDRAALNRLAAPSAIAEFDRFTEANAGDRWFTTGSKCIAEGQPPECEFVLGIGQQKSDVGLIWRLVFGVSDAGTVWVEQAVSGGDAG